jgi:eukaryotic-like serine/threonine-protein kinase
MTTIGEYTITDKQLGEGGNGKVYEGYETLNPTRKVAIKIILAGFKYIKETLEEVNILRILSQSPNCFKTIACIYDHYVDGPYVYVVMELVNGIDLETYMRKYRGPIPFDVLCNIFYQCAYTLDYIHRSGILHRDIKSENIMITREGIVKFVDFGVSCPKLGTNAVAKSGAKPCENQKGVFGTPYTEDPTVRERKFNIDFKSDVYSLGIVMYQLITKNDPYKYSKRIERNYSDWPDVYEKMKIKLKTEHHSCLSPIVEAMINPTITDRPTTSELMQLLDIVMERT